MAKKNLGERMYLTFILTLVCILLVLVVDLVVGALFNAFIAEPKITGAIVGTVLALFTIIFILVTQYEKKDQS